MTDAREPGTYIELDKAWNNPGWTLVPNTIARCTTISRRAKGWVLEVSSHVAGRRLTIEEMVNASTDGRDATRATINELVEAGFLTRHQERDCNGRLGTSIYRLHVQPQNPRSAPFPENPTTVEPSTVGPVPVKPPTSKKTKLLEDQEDANASSSSENEKFDLEEPPAKITRKRRAPRQETEAPARFDASLALRAWFRDSKFGELGINPVWETERWLDYHRAKGSRFKDWDAAWRTWMRNQADYKKQDAAKVNGHGGSRGRGVDVAALPATDWRRFSEQ